MKALVVAILMILCVQSLSQETSTTKKLVSKLFYCFSVIFIVVIVLKAKMEANMG